MADKWTADGGSGAVAKSKDRRRVESDDNNNSTTSTDCESKRLLRPVAAATSSSVPTVHSYCKCCGAKSSEQKLKSRSRSGQNLLKSRSDAKMLFNNASYKEQLEMKLVSDNLCEQLGSDSDSLTRRRAEELGDILRDVSLYAQGVELKREASSRLARKLTNTADTTNPLTNKGGCPLYEVSRLSAEKSELPDDVSEALDEYDNKKKDLATASTNFYDILRSDSRLSNAQLKKLELQFDHIRAAFVQSRSCLESHLLQLTKARKEALKKCFQELGPVVEDMLKEDRQMVELLAGFNQEHYKHESKFHQINDEPPDKGGCGCRQQNCRMTPVGR